MNISKHHTYNNEIDHNYTTKIIKFLDYLNKTTFDLYKFAEESYKPSLMMIFINQNTTTYDDICQK